MDAYSSLFLNFCLRGVSFSLLGRDDVEGSHIGTLGVDSTETACGEEDVSTGGEAETDGTGSGAATTDVDGTDVDEDGKFSGEEILSSEALRSSNGSSHILAKSFSPVGLLSFLNFSKAFARVFTLELTKSAEYP